MIRPHLLLLLLPALVLAKPEPAPELLPIPVADGIYVLPGQLDEAASPDGNSVIVRGPEGLLVVDTGRGGEHSVALLKWLKAQDLPVSAVINSHWHLDHIGGNALFKQALPGVHIYAHPSLDTALAGFHAQNRRELETSVPTIKDPLTKARMQTELDLLRRDRELAATDAITESGTMSFGGRSFNVHLAKHAVTEGDLWLTDPQTRTLIAGDLVTLPVPLLDTACPEAWQATMEEMSRVRFEKLLPGHGAPMTSEGFSAYRRAYSHLLACATGGGDVNTCIGGWFADVDTMVSRTEVPYGSKLLEYYFEHSLKPDAPGRARWCVPAKS